jgi:protease secretion system outer membrane protein
MQPASLDEWSMRWRRSNSAEIRSRRKASSLPAWKSNATRAGHYPQLDLVARAMRAENETISTLNQKSSINTVGVQLNIPLFAGGRVNALTGQAVANRERSLAELDAATNEVHGRSQAAVSGRRDRWLARLPPIARRSMPASSRSKERCAA